MLLSSKTRISITGSTCSCRTSCPNVSIFSLTGNAEAEDSPAWKLGAETCGYAVGSAADGLTKFTVGELLFDPKLEFCPKAAAAIAALPPGVLGNGEPEELC